VPDEPGQVRVFVNYCFAPHLTEMSEIANLFWQQLESIRPQSYISDNDYLTLVSQDQNLFSMVRERIDKFGGMATPCR
jgi:hypothetical protein